MGPGPSRELGRELESEIMAEESQTDGPNVVIMMVLLRDSLLFVGCVSKSPCHTWEY